ncbi:type II toxin-antitoxin system RelE/ParE family toxin [Candidatus Nomurabacteria bacterium]|nr:type II toxin-antitoxin system RelE/ParE family toxin [Candidatus Nomurabacteria bacterium]
MNVHFYETASGRSPVEDFIISLTKPDRARFVEVIVGLEQFGLAYSRVQLKPLRGKLWEIKFNTPSGGFRMAYVLVRADEMVVLHVFRKTTQKTPLHDLDVAEKRMKEVLGL